MQNSKKFLLNLVFYQLSLPELNAAFRWLDRSIVSDFYFDYEPYWKYSCKLSSIGVVEKYVTGRAMYRGRVVDLYLCRVPVTFETVYHPEAISAYTVYKYSDDGDTNQLYYEYSSESGAQYFPYTTEKANESDVSNLPGQFQLSDGNIFGVKYEEEISTLIVDSEGHTENNNQSVTTLFYTQNPSAFKPLTTIVEKMPTEDSSGYWRLTLKNPSAYPTPFKIHCYNVFNGIEIYRIDNSDWMWKSEDENQNDEDVDASVNAELICAVNLKLDTDLVLDLNYNSEDGTVLCANQLIEQIRGVASKIPCVYKNAVANIYVPGTQDPDHPAELVLEIVVRGNENLEDSVPQISVEYNTYEYMI